MASIPVLRIKQCVPLATVTFFLSNFQCCGLKLQKLETKYVHFPNLWVSSIYDPEAGAFGNWRPACGPRCMVWWVSPRCSEEKSATPGDKISNIISIRKKKHMKTNDFRMIGLMKFFLFNVLLPTIDVATDLFTFLTLLPDHPRWASIVLTWMFASFTINAARFLFKRATGKGKPFTTCGDFARDFYKEAGIHLPFVATFHNLWRMKVLHNLKYGTREFRMRDHRQVEKILAEAAQCCHAESIYEAGPQAVKHIAVLYFSVTWVVKYRTGW